MKKSLESKTDQSFTSSRLIYVFVPLITPASTTIGDYRIIDIYVNFIYIYILIIDLGLYNYIEFYKLLFYQILLYLY